MNTQNASQAELISYLRVNTRGDLLKKWST
jgi:hypothetical protein